MLAVNFSTLRQNITEYCDRVTDDSETLIITRQNRKNVVMISQDEYNNLMENISILDDKKYYDKLLESNRQIEQGFCSAHDLIY